MRRHPFSDRLRGITREIVETYASSPIPAVHIDPDRRMPSRRTTVAILDQLFAVLFPGFYGVQHLTHENVEYHVGALLDDIAADLYEQVRLAYAFEPRQSGPGGETGNGEVDRLAGETNVRFAVENMFPLRVRGREVSAYQRAKVRISSIGTPQISAARSGG